MPQSPTLTIAQREILLYVRNKGRVIGTLGAPLFYLVILGFGLEKILPVQGTSYFPFLLCGILAMVVLFQSIFSALSVVTERQFGFLKEMLVAPISRRSIVLGKALGNATTATTQALIVLGLGIALGFSLSAPLENIALAVVLLLLTGIGFSALGLAFASRITDPQTFQFIFNFLVLPLFLLSGAMFPLETAPDWLRTVVLFDPLTYTVEGLRALLLGVSHVGIAESVIALIGFDIAMVLIAAHLFEKMD